jgi:hypothetical protein
VKNLKLPFRLKFPLKKVFAGRRVEAETMSDVEGAVRAESEDRTVDVEIDAETGSEAKNSSRKNDCITQDSLNVYLTKDILPRMDNYRTTSAVGK